MVGLASAAGLVGFLSEPDPTLRSFALHKINEGIDLLWPEVSGALAQMYVLHTILPTPTTAVTCSLTLLGNECDQG